jgi:hypothetical protein
MSNLEYAGWVAKLQREIEALIKAIEAGGMDLSPCKSCGQTVVCVPDGLACCKDCAEKAGG